MSPILTTQHLYVVPATNLYYLSLNLYSFYIYLQSRDWVKIDNVELVVALDVVVRALALTPTNDNSTENTSKTHDHDFGLDNSVLNTIANIAFEDYDVINYN